MASETELGIKAFQQGRYLEAIAAFEQAIQAQPNDPRLHLLLARACHHSGQLGVAQHHYECAIATSDAPQILSVAQQGLEMLSRREVPNRTTVAPAKHTQLPSRPNRGMLACPACGEALVSRVCVCGFDAADPERLGLDLIHAYCAQEGVLVVVRKGLDHYLIDAERVRYRTAGEHLNPVDARVVFAPVHGIPCVLAQELVSIQAPDLKVMVCPRPGAPGEPRAMTFRAFGAEVALTLGVDLPVPLAPIDLARVFAIHRILPPGEIARLQDDCARWGVSFGQGLLKGLNMTPEHVLREVFGPDSYFRPVNRMANNLAWILMSEGLIDPGGLQALLERQVEYPKPLTQLLLSSTSLSAEQLEPYMEQARERRGSRPVRDRLGEILVAAGAVSRTTLDAALEEALNGPPTPFGEVLVRLGVPRPVIERACHQQQVKDQLRYSGQVRLGEILIKRGAISRQQLLEALCEQIDQPIPLGEILIRRGMASPEQVYLGLSQQETTLDAFVTIELDMERQDQAPGKGQTLTLSIDLDREKQRINALFGGLKAGLKAGFQEIKSAIQTASESEPPG